MAETVEKQFGRNRSEEMATGYSAEQLTQLINMVLQRASAGAALDKKHRLVEPEDGSDQYTSWQLYRHVAVDYGRMYRHASGQLQRRCRLLGMHAIPTREGWYLDNQNLDWLRIEVTNEGSCVGAWARGNGRGCGQSEVVPKRVEGLWCILWAQ